MSQVFVGTKAPFPPPVGAKLRHIDGRVYHVRAHVDDQVVMRFFGRHKQWWHYVVESDVAFMMGLFLVYETARPQSEDSPPPPEPPG